MSNEILHVLRGGEPPSDYSHGTTSNSYLVPAEPPSPRTFKDVLMEERVKLASDWVRGVRRDFEAAGSPPTLERSRMSPETNALWEKLAAIDRVEVLWGYVAAPQPSAERAAADVLAGRKFDLSA